MKTLIVKLLRSRHTASMAATVINYIFHLFSLYIISVDALFDISDSSLITLILLNLNKMSSMINKFATTFSHVDWNGLTSVYKDILG